MTPLIKTYKKYLIRKPIEDVVEYLLTLEERRKLFEADINGGIVAIEPPSFTFTIHIVTFTTIRSRTLLHATLHPDENKTVLHATLKPNIAFILLALTGVILCLASIFNNESSQSLLAGFGPGVLIILIACILDIISKKVVLGTFERCLRDIHKQRNSPPTFCLVILTLFMGATSLFSQEKEYKLIARNENADFNYMALRCIDTISTYDERRKIFNPVKGRYTVYVFMSTYNGLSYNNEEKKFHDILIVKTTIRNKILDAYHYTLEWAEPPYSNDLYRASVMRFKLIDQFSVNRLLLRKVGHEIESDPMLNEKGLLSF